MFHNKQDLKIEFFVDDGNDAQKTTKNIIELFIIA